MPFWSFPFRVLMNRFKFNCLYVLVFTSSGNPTESTSDCFHHHSLPWRCDLVDSTGFVECDCTLLYSEITPSLVFGNRIICVRNQIVISVGSFIRWELSARLAVGYFRQSLLIMTTVPKSVWVSFTYLVLWHTWRIDSFVWLTQRLLLFVSFATRGVDWEDFPPIALKSFFTCSTLYLICISLEVMY